MWLLFFTGSFSRAVFYELFLLRAVWTFGVSFLTQSRDARRGLKSLLRRCRVLLLRSVCVHQSVASTHRRSAVCHRERACRPSRSFAPAGKFFQIRRGYRGQSNSGSRGLTRQIHAACCRAGREILELAANRRQPYRHPRPCR